MNVIVDYGMGNLGSILNMIKRIGKVAIISSKISDIEQADRLILPGVGAFNNGMQNLGELGLIDILNQRALVDKIPVLGICLGMQLLTNSSEEGSVKGLGWINAETIKFKAEKDIKLRIPHMGWNTISIKQNCSILNDLQEEAKFYFVHSYYVRCNKDEDILATTNYGGEFASIIKNLNITGAQFHPEKSHKYGMKLIENFLKEGM